MKAALVISLGVLAFAAATPSAAEVRVRYFKGQPTYISTQTLSVVQVALPQPSKAKRQAIIVVALNRGGEAESLGYENVVVRTAAGEPVKMLTYEELRHKAKVRAGWATFFAALAAGANSYAAQQSAYGHSYGSAYTRTPYGGVSTTYSASYYSPVAAQIGQARANAENRELMGMISAKLDETLDKLDGSVLRTTTIEPGESFGGMVVFDLPKGVGLADLVVTVNYAGEAHELALNGRVDSLRQATASEIAAPTSPAAPAPAPPLQPPVQKASLSTMSAPQSRPPSEPPASPGPLQVAAQPQPAESYRPHPDGPQSTMCYRPIKVVTDLTQNKCR
jgi:hypothetical protein